MKRVVIYLQDEHGNETVRATDPMDDEAAEAERRRVEEEHAEAGGQNRWIRLGNVSFQSKELRTIEVSEPPQADAHFGDDATPLFRRDMEL